MTKAPVQPANRVHPLLWVPSLYFAMGIPWTAVSVMAGLMYKNLGLTNAEIGLYTGMMYLPWTIKPFWAPVLELYRSKRFFVIAMEITMMVSFVVLAGVLHLPAYLPLTIAFLWVTGFASATQDIAGDGVYITATTPKEQALNVAVQGTFWNLARMLASGALVSFTQMLFDGTHSWFTAWSVVMLILAAIMGFAAIWHWRVLPTGSRAPDAPKDLGDVLRTMGDAWVSFFKKPKIAMMFAAVFFYRFGEGFIEKIGPLFLMDAREAGGLALDNFALGVNQLCGMLGYIGGTAIGGALASRFSLRRTFVPLAIALNVPHVTYCFLSYALPTNWLFITAVVTLEKLGYGIGTVGMMLYMMQQMAPGPYKTAHYAFATGIMALNMMLTGMLSGGIEEAVGYQLFFVFVLVVSVPPVVIAWFAPFRPQSELEPEGEPQIQA